MQPSYTESFNYVTADGVYEGVPCVVSEAVTWAPKEWRADVDDVQDIARVGTSLVYDPQAAGRGLHALKRHNKHGLRHWVKYLKALDVVDPSALT